jgi:hypothetical protein
MYTKAPRGYLLMRKSIRIIIMPEKLMSEKIVFSMRFAIVLVAFF